MTSRAAAVYGVGGTLLVACLAAAQMPSQPPSFARSPRPRIDAATADVTSEATRLHAMIAQAPVPDPQSRNLFSFAAPASRAPRLPSPTVHAAVADAEPAPVFTAPLPALTLMGIAEDATPAGPRRTAIISGDGDTLFMVTEGQAVGDRYRVNKIGADAVELEDVVTKAYRRLALR